VREREREREREIYIYIERERNLRVFLTDDWWLLHHRIF
jgi:hypothetical protein